MYFKSKHLQLLSAGLLLASQALFANSASAQVNAAYDLLVSNGTAVTRISALGTSYTVTESQQIPNSNTFDTPVRDVAALPFGTGYVLYHGTFKSDMVLFNRLNKTYRTDSYTGLSTVNNITYGGIAILGNFAYVTDMRTFNSPEAQQSGIVRFHLDGSRSDRIVSDTDYIDIASGYDFYDPSAIRLQKIFALRSDEMTVDIIDPDNLSRRTLTLPSAVRAIAVNSVNGDIFGASFSGGLYRFSGNGVTRAKIAVNSRYGFPAPLGDIDIRGGQVVAVDGFGDIFTTTTSFASPQMLQLENQVGPIFVGFARP